uniref:MFS domain-containing protein n=1 Tax=Panagrellus redivivus TaxID=6233 RepID=A0A7E4VME9_PANRE
MTKWILTFSYGLFCTAVISYAMAFNMEQFAGTIYINSAFLGLFRMFLNLSLGGLDYFVKGLGRKKLHQFAISYVVTMTAVVLFMKSTSYGNSTLITLATLSAAGFCSQMFVVIGVISSELFPTSIRNIAASFTSTVARFGGIVSPNLFVLEAYWIGLPYLVIVVCMSIYLVLFQLNIPETKSAVQSDAMPEKSEWGRKSKKGDKLLKSKTNGQNV